MKSTSRVMIEVTIVDFIETSPVRFWILASRKTVRNNSGMSLPYRAHSVFLSYNEIKPGQYIP